jgi:hypothetical protein
MKHISTLKVEARIACEARGHDMKYFDTLARPNPLMGIQGTVARTHCRKCGREVQVETHPAPNSIDIGGEALAINCI